jgi:hypothetical protein
MRDHQAGTELEHCHRPLVSAGKVLYRRLSHIKNYEDTTVLDEIRDQDKNAEAGTDDAVVDDDD